MRERKISYTSADGLRSGTGVWVDTVMAPISDFNGDPKPTGCAIVISGGQAFLAPLPDITVLEGEVPHEVEPKAAAGLRWEPNGRDGTIVGAHVGDFCIAEVWPGEPGLFKVHWMTAAPGDLSLLPRRAFGNMAAARTDVETRWSGWLSSAGLSAKVPPA